jgi:D-alanyl-D-alanine endopeptidase (penicillin-binding protein 7)
MSSSHRSQGPRSSGRCVRKVRRGGVASRWPPARAFGQVQGLHATEDPLDLKSSVALVIDQDTNQVLFSKNPRRCCPSRRSPS